MRAKIACSLGSAIRVLRLSDELVRERLDEAVAEISAALAGLR